VNYKVSIIIPTFNGLKTIQKTLQSVFSQTYHNYEVIVVDDGSTDATVDFIKANFTSVKVLQQKNQGTLAARQAGINIATGELIALLDQDDVWLDKALQKNVEVLTQNPAIGLVLANMECIDDEGVSRNFNVVPEQKCYTPTWEELLLFHPIANSVALFRKELVDKIGGLDSNFGFSGALGDTDTFARLAEIAQVLFINECLGYYRWSEMRPGRLFSFLENLKVYVNKHWQHPSITAEDAGELREKFVRACCDYGIVIWRLLLQQFDQKISLSVLEKLNEHNAYMQSAFADYYDRIIGLQSIQIKVFQTEKESIRTLLFLYLLRKELQEFYPGVLRGELRELLSWASDVAHKQIEDIDFSVLEKYAAELLRLERDNLNLECDSLENELSRTKLELASVYNSRSWRITEPLRKVVALQRSLRQKLSRFASARMLLRQVLSKSIRVMMLWVAARPRLYQMGIKLFNRFPGIKKRLKAQIYRDPEEMTYFPVYEQPLPMSPPVMKIHMDLLVAIQKQKQKTSGE